MRAICIYQSEWSSGAFRGGTDDASMQCVKCGVCSGNFQSGFGDFGGFGGVIMYRLDSSKVLFF